MNLTFFVGPQLIGTIMLLAGLVMKYYPPKNINGLYGYRTPRSMANQRNWDEANKYSAVLMIKLGAAGIALGVLLLLLLPAAIMPLISAGATLISLIAIVATLLVATERHLKNLSGADAL